MQLESDKEFMVNGVPAVECVLSIFMLSRRD